MINQKDHRSWKWTDNLLMRNVKYVNGEKEGEGENGMGIWAN